MVTRGNIIRYYDGSGPTMVFDAGLQWEPDLKRRYIDLTALLRGNYYNCFFPNAFRCLNLGFARPKDPVLHVPKIQIPPCNRVAKNGPSGLYNEEQFRASSTTFPWLRLQSKRDKAVQHGFFEI